MVQMNLLAEKERDTDIENGTVDMKEEEVGGGWIGREELTYIQYQV